MCPCDFLAIPLLILIWGLRIPKSSFLKSFLFKLRFMGSFLKIFPPRIIVAEVLPGMTGLNQGKQDHV